ncbi:class I SAM-dependent methyltransferase [Mycolicibacter icosiumassiliensis]|uniref:class I SAM-dependent methyltransferase n=1 Tax=Mycolicibacter icosiumassiliensis TaxID=1792835 RepID=UPI001F17D347|nr:class I SAM-dependent methyltransferase [Mycolicibacter icosiumassiliensis]
MPDFDFEALYRGESPAPGVPAMPTPPWDLRRPKESVLGWHTQGLVRGAVLDIGCGYGDNAIYLAQHGLRVTGLDISPTALVTAERRAAAAGVSVRFAVADATRLDGYTDAFDTVVDSGTFHCLDDESKHRYAAAVHRATRAGTSQYAMVSMVPSCCGRCTVRGSSDTRSQPPPVSTSRSVCRQTATGSGRRAPPGCASQKQLLSSGAGIGGPLRPASPRSRSPLT